LVPVGTAEAVPFPKPIHETTLVRLGGRAEEAAEKCNVPKERPPGLKPALIVGLRGPEGPLFHGHARIREFFRKL
jgi:hypothetical protein